MTDYAEMSELRVVQVAATTQRSMAGGLRCSLWNGLVAVMVVCGSVVTEVGAVPAATPEQCGASGCTLDNAYKIWNDRIPCQAAKVAYPTTESEIVSAVASAVRANQKIKVSTAYGHSMPKGACPGGSSGLIVSSRNLNKILSVDRRANTVTAQSGITWRALLDTLAPYGLTLTVAPFFDAVTLGGAIANSVHGSSLWKKGGAVHEYVVGMTLVTPATESEGYAKVRRIGIDDPDLNAAKVHLGVLGVVSTVTLQAEPMFKRNVTMQVVMGDEGLNAEKVLKIANGFEYAEVYWYPGLRQVVYKLDSRVPVSTSGMGKNAYLGMQAQAQPEVEVIRTKEEVSDKTGCRSCKCGLAFSQVSLQQTVAYGFQKKNQLPNLDLLPGILPGLLPGFPVIGLQNSMANAGGCQSDPKPLFYCAWDARVNGLTYYDAGAALPLRNVGAFIDDVKALRERAPAGSLCDLDLYTGILFRFTKKTEAYMGTAQEDSAMLDFAWSRPRPDSHANDSRMDMDVFQEVEQIAFDKHDARPHWGKNRNWVFDNVSTKYPNLQKFLAVKSKFDPHGFFSSEWSDAILGVSGPPVRDEPFCAAEGNCKCSSDLHCAAGSKYNACRPGLVYPAARVCR